MLVIGLTGGIGSGKTTVANLFAEFNVPIIDSDVIANELTSPGAPLLQEIALHFGPKILDKNRELIRDELKRLVFKNIHERKWLEELMHPLICNEIMRRVASIRAPYCIIIIPLLIEAQVDKLINRILVVDAPEESQIQRTMSRDNCTEGLVKKIMMTQVSRQRRLDVADDIIVNDGNQESLKRQVQHLHEKYLGMV